MESWRKVWREGIVPQLSTTGLEALRKALKDDDPRLIQQYTVFPFPSLQENEWITAGCGIAYCGWQGGLIQTVDQAEEYILQIVKGIDLRFGDKAAAHFFLSWFDETPRKEMRRLLLAEVSRTLAQRSEQKEYGAEKRKVVTA